MHADHEHHLDWNERLQDWLDGDVDPADAAAVESHLRDCAICQGRLRELEQLDEALSAAAPRIGLDASFDQRLLARIDEQTETVDAAKRAAARQRIEQELQENLRALARGWRRTLAFVIPGIIAGIAIAFALTGWLEDSGLTQMLIAESAGQVGRTTSDMIHLAVTASLGAGLGLIMARWLATVAE